MKKFARKFLLTPYMKYGKSILFNALVPIVCGVTTIIGAYFPYSIAFEVMVLLTILVGFSIVSITLAGSLTYKWSDLSDYQKLNWGEGINHNLTLEETCEWVRLYGAKITRNEINSKL